ncbi:hypothetical protein [Asanoa iriomotensis]|uniref:Uncharacterized protein n=1 Tax=Asanoa iriomotensis TaxID=234613 RepID=A0ABQ4C434_9ACTN|nr:hypothetical protein [Asanoa iriomotensis]GIF57191.1 hypothetical protein Air01nite_32860 [Asanoa iriomotensis]
MPSQPAPGDPLSYPAHAFPNVAIDVFTAREWELLVRLPGRVIVAATQAGSPGRTVRDGLAGLEAMAAGRAFDSDLVRAVVAAVYTERLPSGTDRPRRDLLDDCRDALRVLGDRADPADSAAYRQWLQSIAARVCTGGRGPAVGQLGPGDRRFLADLGHALGMV